MIVKDARKISREGQEALRKRVIHAVVEQKMRQIKAAEVFQVSRTAIFKWLKAYKKSGVGALNKKVQGRPRQSGKFKGWQSAWVVRTITDKCPDQMKLPWGLWTRDAVRELIWQKFEIKLSISSVSRLLKKWGFTPQKPIRRAIERNPEVIKRWMKEEYPRIHALAKKENAQIHWGDEMGVRSEDQVGRSFGRKGQTPVIPKTGKRFGCNMISTVTNDGRCRFMMFEESFTADVFLKFLAKLIYKADRKLFLIVDNHRVHHAKKLTKWLECHSKQLQIFYLPPYAPELNPDELLNQDVKANATRHLRPSNQPQLKKIVRAYLKKIQKLPDRVQNYFKKKELAYVLNADFAKC